MFKLINKIVDPISSTLNAASAVISTTANAVVAEAEAGAAKNGCHQLSTTINNGLLSLSQTTAAVAIEAVRTNAQSFIEAKQSDPVLANFDSLQAYLNAQMSI